MTHSSFPLSLRSPIIVYHLEDSRSQRVLWLLVCIFIHSIHPSITIESHALMYRKNWNFRTKSRNTNEHPRSVRLRSYSTSPRWESLQSSQMATSPSLRVGPSWVSPGLWSSNSSCHATFWLSRENIIFNQKIWKG